MKRAMKIGLGIVLFLLLAGGLLLLAIRTNGPAVLNGIDGLTGGGRGVTLGSNTQYGPPRWIEALPTTKVLMSFIFMRRDPQKSCLPPFHRS